MRGSLVFILAFICLTTPTLAEPGAAHDAREILMRANVEAAKLTAIAFTATLSGEGVLAQQFPKLTGKVLARRADNGSKVQMRIDGTATPTGAQAGNGGLVKYINNGAEVFLIDDVGKTVKHGRPEDTAGLAINGMCPPKFLGDSAFREELRGASIMAEPAQVVEGVECDVVSVSYDAKGAKTAKVFIGKKDGLLRRLENGLALRMPGRSELFRGTLTFTATNLDTRPKIEDKSFAYEIPAEYKKEPFPVETGGGGTPNGPAPEWELSSADGKTVSLKSLRGKFVVLDFWATWCGPCKMAMPGMQKLHERFKDKPVVVYGMNCWERNPDPMAYIKSKGYTYPQLLKADSVATKYGISGIPAIFVIDPEGKIVHTIRGFVADAEAQIARIIEPSLKK